jgi:signal transduction histidine kinase
MDKDFAPNLISSKHQVTELHTIIHEIRNPITNISLSCDRINEETQDLEVRKEIDIYLEIIKRNCGKINQLVCELVQKVEIENTIQVSLNDLIEETLQMASDRIKLKKILVEKYYYSGDTTISCKDEVGLKRALLNIINNAIEAITTSEGLITIMTLPNSNRLQLVIADNGSGIPEESISKLFQPYFTQKNNGLGIGLSVTKKILEGNNAEIDVQSSVGAGTIFIVSFLV